MTDFLIRIAIYAAIYGVAMALVAGVNANRLVTLYVGWFFGASAMFWVPKMLGEM